MKSHVSSKERHGNSEMINIKINLGELTGKVETESHGLDCTSAFFCCGVHYSCTNHHHPPAAEQATTRFLHARRSSASAVI